MVSHSPCSRGCRGRGLPGPPRNMLLEGAPGHDLDLFWWLGLVSQGFKDWE